MSRQYQIKIPERREIHEGSPMIALAFCLGLPYCCSTGKENLSRAWRSHWAGKIDWNSKLLRHLGFAKGPEKGSSPGVWAFCRGQNSVWWFTWFRILNNSWAACIQVENSAWSVRTDLFWGWELKWWFPRFCSALRSWEFWEVRMQTSWREPQAFNLDYWKPSP